MNVCLLIVQQSSKLKAANLKVIINKTVSINVSTKPVVLC